VAVTSPQGRFAAEATRVHGRTLASVEAWGKHLYYTFEDGGVVHVHMGLAGRFRTMETPAPVPGGMVRMRLESPTHAADLTGPMVCELIDPAVQNAQVAKLGPDVLRDDANPERAWAAIHRTRRPVGALLMDQSVMAGVGNIYRCEVLLLAGIAPGRPGKELRRAEFDTAWKLLTRLMRLGVKRNRIETVSAMAPELNGDGNEFFVYGRETCLRCGGPVEVTKLAGRRVHACPACQH
jgi:endonuclease-8